MGTAVLEVYRQFRVRVQRRVWSQDGLFSMFSRTTCSNEILYLMFFGVQEGHFFMNIEIPLPLALQRSHQLRHAALSRTNTEDIAAKTSAASATALDPIISSKPATSKHSQEALREFPIREQRSLNLSWWLLGSWPSVCS